MTISADEIEAQFSDGESTSPSVTAGVTDSDGPNYDDSEPFSFDELRPEEVKPIVEPKATAAPREPREKRTQRKLSPSSAPPYRAGQFIEPLTQLYAFAGVGLMPFDPHCAMTIAQSGEDCAKAWDELAKNNLAVRRALQSLLATGAWSGVIAAHAPILVAVLAHHAPGMIPPAMRPQDEPQEPTE
jgi:hypothetical protein